ncbi:hypothetical protein QVD17_36212 [Tagetes erecta]|uniref:RING-type domain-containing protein n=1 Tax=Tagetes erecta TaxID=13708 RepID=A0AAD8NIW8_TARER|nr:hypothetical protein QVD17_36212 [Tagetes erecta]
MICVVYEGYGSSILTLIFITCIWLPFLQIKHAFLHIFSIIMAIFYDDDQNVLFPNIYRMANVRLSDLQDVINGDDDDDAKRWVDESCSICLAEFEDDDKVSQLSRCCHVFHACCIERWLNRDQFTCPLCRSNLLGKQVVLNQSSDEQFAPYWQW